jgi:hypothetical protein
MHQPVASNLTPLRAHAGCAFQNITGVPSAGLCTMPSATRQPLNATILMAYSDPNCNSTTPSATCDAIADTIAKATGCDGACQVEAAANEATCVGAGASCTSTPAAACNGSAATGAPAAMPGVVPLAKAPPAVTSPAAASTGQGAASGSRPLAPKNATSNSAFCSVAGAGAMFAVLVAAIILSTEA